MRADRLLSLLLLLQARGRMTAPQLAAELEVSVRTVYRDVEALAASGVPVYADRGPAGGYRLLDGYRTRLTGLTPDEADALALAGTPAAAAQLGLGAELAAARRKVRAALPGGPAPRSRRIEERFLLDAAGWFREADGEPPYLAVLADAVWRQRVLRVRYAGWAGAEGAVRDRVLWPLGLVLKSGVWYAVAVRGPDAEPRTYRVARVRAAEPAGGTFERPADFDLAAFWSDATRRLQEAQLVGVAELRLAPDAARMLPAVFGAAGQRALREAAEPDGEGWLRVRLPVEALPVAVGDVLRLGVAAEVVGPPELRAAVADAVAVLARRYGRVAGASA